MYTKLLVQMVWALSRAPKVECEPFEADTCLLAPGRLCTRQKQELISGTAQDSRLGMVTFA